MSEKHLCECSSLTRYYPESIITNHHRDCKFYNPNRDVIEIISNLLKGIREWASDEDGVHPACVEAYNKAAIAIRENVLSEETK